jgi:NADH-quinone oxidoreductase subunit J
LLGRFLYAYGSAAGAAELSDTFGTTKVLSRVLFRDHIVAFELTSVLLLVAIVGAVVLAQRDKG